MKTPTAVPNRKPIIKMCGNCWHALFRDYHGELRFYCGYYFNPTLFDREACINWISEKPKNK